MGACYAYWELPDAGWLSWRCVWQAVKTSTAVAPLTSFFAAVLQVGLRPGRPSVRLELEQFPLDQQGPVQQQQQQQNQQQNQQQPGQQAPGQQPFGQRQRQTGGASSAGKASLPVVHNYGHGGSGLTLAWGCAADAAALVQQALNQLRHGSGGSGSI
jgi:hypothetical protein